MHRVAQHEGAPDRLSNVAAGSMARTLARAKAAGLATWRFRNVLSSRLTASFTRLV